MKTGIFSGFAAAFNLWAYSLDGNQIAPLNMFMAGLLTCAALVDVLMHKKWMK